MKLKDIPINYHDSILYKTFRETYEDENEIPIDDKYLFDENNFNIENQLETIRYWQFNDLPNNVYEYCLNNDCEKLREHFFDLELFTNILDLKKQNFNFNNNEKKIKFTIKKNYFELFKYLYHNIDIEYFENDITKYAALKGHLECLKYVHQNGCPIDINKCLKYCKNNDVRNYLESIQQKIEIKNNCNLN